MQCTRRTFHSLADSPILNKSCIPNNLILNTLCTLCPTSFSHTSAHIFYNAMSTAMSSSPQSDSAGLPAALLLVYPAKKASARSSCGANTGMSHS